MDALTGRLDAAAERVSAERRAVVAERDALDEFVTRVEDLGADGGRTVADGGVRTGATAPGPALGPPGSERTAALDELGAVREAFVDLVVPTVPDHVADDSPAATLRDELGPEVAGALAGEGPLPPPLRTAIRESVAERRRELDATGTLLDREREQLAAGRDLVETVTAWLHAADETPLPELGFDALRERHERLDRYRERCDTRAEERGAFLRATTGRDGCRVTREPFFAYLYGTTGRPAADHPVLATVADLADAVGDCQRNVRAHLTRRG